jgi:SNF2 family DNA or RNA helicase
MLLSHYSPPVRDALLWLMFDLPPADALRSTTALQAPGMVRLRDDLRSYQVATVGLIKRVWSLDATVKIPGIILAYDMGSGKTASTLTALVDLFAERRIRKVLIVAPLLVAQTTWPDEIEGWEHTRHLTYTVLRADDEDPDIAWAIKKAEEAVYRNARFDGSTLAEARRKAGAAGTAARQAIRKQLAETDTQVHIINKEGLEWLFEHFGEAHWPYDVVVIDEASMLKSGRKRTKGKDSQGNKTPTTLSRFGILSRVRKKLTGVIELTGTPSPNGLQNLWGLAYIVDFGERLGTARTAFEQRWFDTNPYSRKMTPAPHALGEITDRLKDIMFSLDPADYAALPPLMPPNMVKVRLPAAILDRYHDFRRTLVSEPYDVEAVSQGVLVNKLLQFANGSLYQEDGNDVLVHGEKLRALEEMFERADGEPLLVAYSFQFDRQKIISKFKDKVTVLDRGDPRGIMRRWNDGRIPMLLAHPASAGHGLNLQFGGHQSIWYGLTHDLELWQQFNKRLHRPGQQRPVFLHAIVAEGTIDETIIPLLDNKKSTQDDVLEAVRFSVRSRLT